MSRIRGRDTAPEMAVRRELHAMGARFRLQARDLPGRPDVVNRSRRWAVFVHGCFWHAHEGCPGSGLPKTNVEAWRAKFLANRERDARSLAALEGAGYRVLVVWECACRDRGALRRELAGHVGLPAACAR